MRSAREGSFHWFFCESSSTKAVGPLFFWSYVYYLSKYYELLDTVLQMMRGRPPPHFALHVYHHGCVLMMAWAWSVFFASFARRSPRSTGGRARSLAHYVLFRRARPCLRRLSHRCEYQQTLQFGGLIFNTAVHVVMYLYFFLRVVSGPPWWKPLVTKFQIVQFMTSVLCFCYTAYLIFGLKEPCHGQGALAVRAKPRRAAPRHRCRQCCQGCSCRLLLRPLRRLRRLRRLRLAATRVFHTTSLTLDCLTRLFPPDPSRSATWRST